MAATKAGDVKPGSVAPTSSLNSSTLLRTLNRLQATDVKTSQGDFAQRLAQLLDFNDSINLSSALDKLARLPFEQSGANAAVLQEDFQRSRRGMLQSLQKSFAPDSNSRIRLPAVAPQVPADATAAFEPYQKFYTAQQRQLDFSAQNIQAHVRDTVSGLSPQLAQLAAMDAALGKTLLAHSRKHLARVPQLLHKRFAQLVDECQAEDARGAGKLAWQQQHWRFCAEMHEMLVAEVETRLLPTLGLIEAINEHT